MIGQTLAWVGMTFLAIMLFFGPTERPVTVVLRNDWREAVKFRLYREQAQVKFARVEPYGGTETVYLRGWVNGVRLGVRAETALGAFPRVLDVFELPGVDQGDTVSFAVGLNGTIEWRGYRPATVER